MICFLPQRDFQHAQGQRNGKEILCQLPFLLQIMKILILIGFVIGLSTCFQLFSHLSNSPNFKVTYTVFTAVYPQANLPTGSQLYIRGDTCNLTWTKGVSIKKTGTDTWSTALLCPLETKISVKLLINDTKWMMGANHIFTIGSSESNPNIKIFPSFYPSINKVVDTNPISSTILKNQRRISIYYPPSYHDNKYKTYELLILHDGQNLFDNSKAAFGVAWMCQNTVNTLIAQGKMSQILMVGIWNTNDRINEYTYSYDPSQKLGGKGDLYIDFIQKQLLPKLHSEYFPGRIDDSKGVGIGGSSLGGLISCYAAYTRPQVFNKGVCMSSSFWWNNQDFKGTVVKSKPYTASTILYLDSGDSGPSQDNKLSTDGAKAALLGKGYIENKNLFYYLDKGGQHSQSYWGKRFWVPMTDLYSAG